MNPNLLMLGIYMVGMLLFSMLLLLIPIPTMGVLTTPFSFKTFGIRKVKRWNSRTDTLGNIFLWISVLFCIGFPFIPFAKWIYLAWLLFSWLAAASRAVRLTQVHSAGIKLTVLFFLNATMGIGFLSAWGFFNNFALWKTALGWIADIQSGEARKIVYYLNQPNLFAYLLQVVLLLLPLVIFWGQFKYMRLENTFKARNIVFYVIKMIFWNAVLLAGAVFGYPYLMRAYSHDIRIQISADFGQLPEDGALPFELNPQPEQEAETKPAEAPAEERSAETSGESSGS